MHMTGEMHGQKNVYAHIHTVVYFQPFLHITISSIRSCSQNTGPTLATNRRKFAVVSGIDSGSLVESSSLGVPLVARGAAGAFAGSWNVDDSSTCWNADLVGDRTCVGVDAAAAALRGAVSGCGRDVTTFIAGRRLVEATFDWRRVADGGIST